MFCIDISIDMLTFKIYCNGAPNQTLYNYQKDRKVQVGFRREIDAKLNEFLNKVVQNHAILSQYLEQYNHSSRVLQTTILSQDSSRLIGIIPVLNPDICTPRLFRDSSGLFFESFGASLIIFFICENQIELNVFDAESFLNSMGDMQKGKLEDRFFIKKNAKI